MRLLHMASSYQLVNPISIDQPGLYKCGQGCGNQRGLIFRVCLGWWECFISKIWEGMQAYLYGKGFMFVWIGGSKLLK